MKKQFETILLERRLVFVPSDKTEEDEKKRAYLNSFLLVNFGVELENPERVCDDVIRSLDDLLSLKVPESFYESPQDTAYFNKDELLLEQVVSYFLGYGTNLKRVELFKKVLPRKYVVGGEIKTRKYRIIDEKEADNSLKEVASNLASYKRPFSPAETVRFLSLMKEGYFPVDGEIACRDNIFPLLEDFPDLASRLDKKDLVKLSIEYFGDGDKLVFFPDDEDDARHLAILRGASTKVRDCPLSKRQAKYFNKILKITSGKKGKETNEASPYKKLNKMMKEKGAVSAAEYLSTQGSLLERNLRYLLSRCVNAKQVREVIDKLDDKNPTLLFQIYSSFTKDRKGQRRTFVYAKDKKIRTHVETQEEVEKRRSFLLPAVKGEMKKAIAKKIYGYYEELPSLGKIYVSDEFKRVAIPTSTLATGKGVDVLPCGSRIPFSARYIRVFVHWKDVRDIDASLAVMQEEDFDKAEVNDHNVLSWRSYYLNPFDGLALCSGDDTSTKGAEYQDIDVDGLAEKGYHYAVAGLNGYGGSFNEGTVVQGIQIKNEINTKPWDPKNIEFQMNVNANARAYVGFAIDLKSKEIVIINIASEGSIVFGQQQLNLCKRFLNEDYLGINMYDILYRRGEVVENPEDADIVFASNYPSKDKKVIHPFDVDSLIAIVNEKPVQKD